MDKERIKSIITHELDGMSLFPFRNIFIFGDCKNDIDIAIIVDDAVDKSYVIESLSSTFINISIKLNKLITVTPITESEFCAAKTTFIKNIREETDND
jgi:hypothetical protein